jgi:hypothetical protein
LSANQTKRARQKARPGRGLYGYLVAATVAAAAEAATAISAEATTTAAATTAAAEAATTTAAAAEAATAFAAEATTTAAAAEATTITPAEAGALFARTSDIDLQGASHEVDAFGLRDGGLGMLVRRHRYEGEAASTAGELIAHNFHASYLAKLGEVCADVILSGCPREVADKQFIFHVFFFRY